MIVAAFFFYLFACICVASAVMVISSRNPVHSVLWLILAFVNAAGLFMLLGAEFLAFILIVVYVGAVAVLFLFVIMMLDIDVVTIKHGVLQYLPVGLLIGGVVLIELLLVVGAWAIGPDMPTTAAMPIPANVTNTEALGLVLYTRYAYFFEAAGVILLIAMIGAIVLTLEHRVRVKRQNISEQVHRDPKTAIEVLKVRTGQGLGSNV
jgi:NADH-quinone oxidoreductase subunit J